MINKIEGMVDTLKLCRKYAAGKQKSRQIKNIRVLRDGGGDKMRKRLMCVGLVLMMSLSLTACKSKDYKNAVKLQESSDYKVSLEVYKTIGDDYKDVSNRISECEAYVTAINDFDRAVAAVKSKNTDLDAAVSNVDKLFNNKDIALDETRRPALETSISDAKAVKCDISEMPSALEEIEAKKEEFKKIDYTDALAKLDMAYKALDKSIKQYALVNNPKESYIIKCLGKVTNVVDISAVTEGNDPNGHLNKAGGYTTQVYFSSDLVNQSSVSGATVIDKGTQFGGSIEVYSTVEDAKKRNDYLAAFDGGILASGSHMVIGTCLVRLSDKLTASEQTAMEKNIIKILTYVEK
jgi:hypothetical protein